MGKVDVKTVSTVPRQHTQALARWAKRWGTPNLVRRVRIAYSPRLRRSLGRVRPKSGIITLHSGLATAPQAALLEVLCHEAAHVAAYMSTAHARNRTGPNGASWSGLPGMSPSRACIALDWPWRTRQPARSRLGNAAAVRSVGRTTSSAAFVPRTSAASACNRGATFGFYWRLPPDPHPCPVRRNRVFMTDRDHECP